MSLLADFPGLPDQPNGRSTISRLYIEQKNNSGARRHGPIECEADAAIVFNLLTEFRPDISWVLVEETVSRKVWNPT